MSDYPEMNTMLMEEVMAFIKDNPSKHNQDSWVDAKYDANDEMCGTTCCFAGHAMLLSGKYDIKNFGSRMDPEWGFVDKATADEIEYSEHSLAAELLGLTRQESNHLFLSEMGENMDRSLEQSYKDVMNGEFRKD